VFPVRFKVALDSLPDLRGYAKPKAMSVWKYIGDEVLFTAELVRHEDAFVLAAAFRNALDEYCKVLRGKKKTDSLGLKGAIWGAGFPVNNTIVDTEVAVADGGSKSVRDFIGPSIDLGFRLAKSADADRIPVSADVALMIATAAITRPQNATLCPLMFDPPVVLAGIAEGRPYPIISIDRREGTNALEDKLLGRNRKCDPAELKRYLEGAFQSNRWPGIDKPFIESDPDPYFGSVPKEYGENRDRIMGEVTASQGSSAAEGEAPAVAGNVRKPKQPVSIKKKRGR
jgi:hypothetical protein